AIVNGAVTIAGLPSGTFAVEARALGYESEKTFVELFARTVTHDTIILQQKVQRLEALNATASPNSKLMSEILAMKQKGFGRFYLPGDNALASATILEDVVRVAPGFRLDKFGLLEARVMGGLSLLRCHPTIYVDGVRDGDGSRPGDGSR